MWRPSIVPERREMQEHYLDARVAEWAAQPESCRLLCQAPKTARLMYVD